MREELAKLLNEPLLTPNELRKLAGLEPLENEIKEPLKVRRYSFICKNCGSTLFCEIEKQFTCNYCGTIYKEGNE